MIVIPSGILPARQAGREDETEESLLFSPGGFAPSGRKRFLPATAGSNDIGHFAK